MRALRLEAPGKLAEVRIGVPAPAPDELLIETGAATICTSDLHDLARNPFQIPLPRVLGHEAAGVVRELGSAVQGFQPGDRVAAHPVIPCQDCPNCRRGLGHLCSRMGHLGLDRDGSFAEFFTLPARRARLISDAVPAAVGALLEPVAVSLEAIVRSGIQAGQTLLVVGDGPFGVLIARLAEVRFHARVLLVGQHDFRMARAPGAIRIPYRGLQETLAALRAQSPEPEGLDAAILAVGTPSAVELGVESLRARGRLVLFSAIESAARLDYFRIHTRELEVVGACNDEDLIDDAHACLADPTLALEQLITHELPFDQWRRAFDLAQSGQDQALKVALIFGGAP
ncbi:MAG: alcohol dehydrogenase catalytic domain-containing protein [Verrucomicrobiae bacterium]|nr:alcohol dehydrogenase catalytic domain-containing protein [Verrucomicrobiae bacterium]